MSHQGSSYAALQVSAFQINRCGNARLFEDGGQQIGGGGFAIGAGNKNHLADIKPLKVPVKAVVYFEGNFTGQIGAAARSHDIDSPAAQARHPQGKKKFNSGHYSRSLISRYYYKPKRRYLQRAFATNTAAWQ